MRTRLPSRFATTASAAPIPPPGRACGGCRTGSRCWMGGWRSIHRWAEEPRCGHLFPFRLHLEPFLHLRRVRLDGPAGACLWSAMADPRASFLKTAATGAQAGAREFGVPASVTLAQAVLESGWGKFHLGPANNYFGIKAFARGGRVDVGPIAAGFVVRQTHEVVGGRDVVVSARFRSYRSLGDSMRDHGQFLRANSRYAPAFAFSRDPNGFARAIAKAGYATDPAYADKLIGIMRANDLYRFDGGSPPRPVPAPAPVVHASVAALQRNLNAQLARLGARERLAIDGRWDPRTELAFRRVCKLLGVAPRRGLRTYRIIAGADVALTEAEKLRASTEGAAYAAKLRARFARVDPAPPDPLPAPGPGLDPRARRRAYIAVLQRDLNALLASLGARSKLAVSGEWDKATDVAFRRACRVLGVEAKRSVRAFRVIAGAAASRTADEIARAGSDGAAYEAKLRAQFLHAPVEPAARTFRIQSPHMTGDDIRAFQRVVNERFRRWGVAKGIEEDGEYGSLTRLAVRQVCHALGLAKADYPGGITPALRLRVSNPSRRSPEELARARARRGWLERMRRQHEGGGAELALAYARKHLGVRETGSNRGELVDKWNRAGGSPLGSAWCGNFMNACLMNAGFPSESWMARCAFIEGHARTGQGGWEWTSTPKPGDLVLFTVDNAPNHVGMVESVETGAVVTIEGNTHPDDEPGAYGVFRRHHPRSVPRGYARPPYGR